MCQRIRYPLEIAFAVLLLIAVPSVGMSQSIWLPPSEGHSITLEVFKIDWSGDRFVTFASSAWFLTVRYQTSSSLTIVGELPLSRFDTKSIGFFDEYVDAEILGGNPYIGILINPENSGMFSEIGIRLPMASDSKLNASVSGWISEFDRWEAFIPNLWTVRGRIGANIGSRSGSVRARLLGGSSLWIPTADGDPEVFVDAVGQFWLQHDQFMVGATLIGRSVITQRIIDWKERFEFQVGLDANRTFGIVRPGFHVHIPIASEGLIGVGRTVDFILGVNVTFLLGQPRRNDDRE